MRGGALRSVGKLYAVHHKAGHGRLVLTLIRPCVILQRLYLPAARLGMP